MTENTTWDTIIKDTVYTYETTTKGGVGHSVIVGSRPRTEQDVPSPRAQEIEKMWGMGTNSMDSKGNYVWTRND